MTREIRYDATAARKLLDPARLSQLEPALSAARDEIFADLELLRSPAAVPASKQPLDAGFIDLPQRLLEERSSTGEASLLGQMDRAASELRNDIDRLVSLGIGGSYMGARALFEALCRPFHNELNRSQREGTPRLYFEGNNLDNDTLSGLLHLLRTQCRDATALEERWGLLVISKSGGTLETAVAFRLFRDALENYYGIDSAESRRLVVAITGDSGKLRDLATKKPYTHTFPIPDNVGGRYSVFSAVGLFPAALLGLDVNALLEGARDMTDVCRNEPCGNNPVLDYVGVCRLAEQQLGATTRILSTWGSRLEALGFWYDQLLSESLGKQEQGATPITAVNTRDLHSRGQQHQEGARDKLITNVIVESISSDSVAVPSSDHDEDQLNRLAGKPVHGLLSAAIRGTNRAYAEAGRPTADILVPRLDEYCIGQFLQMLMLATVVEGRLIGVNPYGQPGVEAYKKNMSEILYGG